jgi:hypothetical protein
MGMELFTQAQVNKILNHIPYTTTRDWAKAGYFQWHDGPEDGRGVARLYSRVNLYQIALCGIFIRNANIRPNSIKIFMEYYFVTDNKDENKVTEMFNHYLIFGVKNDLVHITVCIEKVLKEEIAKKIPDHTITSVINLKMIKDDVDNLIKNNLG